MKLKEHYKTEPYVLRSGETIFVPRWFGQYRPVKTTNERAQADFCFYDEDCLEYGVLPRAKRNAVNIPSAYDDVDIAAWKYLASWKHNSKRRKQWKVKDHDRKVY